MTFMNRFFHVAGERVAEFLEVAAALMLSMLPQTRLARSIEEDSARLRSALVEADARQAVLVGEIEDLKNQNLKLHVETQNLLARAIGVEALLEESRQRYDDLAATIPERQAQPTRTPRRSAARLHRLQEQTAREFGLTSEALAAMGARFEKFGQVPSQAPSSLQTETADN